jgi:sulfotransferase family protein
MQYNPNWPNAAALSAVDFSKTGVAWGLRKPNFFIIGSMKSGTTYLQKILADHPSIFMCGPKEPCHFVEGAQLKTLWPWAWKRGYWKNEQTYLELFQHSGAAPIIGEASVYYTHLPLASGVAQRIYDFNPEARLLYLMRDPIDRTISHYWHRVRYHGEHRSAQAAIRSDPQYLDVSHYAMQLTPYLRLFRHDQILALTFEQLIDDTEKSIASILRWLNVDGSNSAPGPAVAENVTPKTVEQRMGGGYLYGLRDKSKFLRALIDQAPISVRRFGARAVTRTIDREGSDVSDVVEYLRPRQQRQMEQLIKLLGREFPEWTRLYAR